MLADALGPREDQALRDASAPHGLTQQRDERRMTDDRGERHAIIVSDAPGCALVARMP
jgi:hypothetical protein